MYSFLLLACAVFAGSSALMAQATALSSRTLSVSTFATGGVTNTDYSLQDHGLTFGTDLTHYYRLVQPSLEVRSTMTSGSVVRQRTLSAGLKLEKGYRALHPYGDFLVGYGVISFPQNTSFPRDNSTVWTYGGGVEYQVSRSFLLKADIQQQSWKPGVEYSRFTPTLMTVGFSYRPFRRNVIR
jgi:opacity protein-like surface antigen